MTIQMVSSASPLQLDIDGSPVSQGQFIDLHYLTLGPHQLSVETNDYLGNESLTKTQFNLTVTRESLIDEINRLYTLGLITKNGVKNSLLHKATYFKYRALLKELKAQRNKAVKDEAYLILVEEVNWLLSH